MPWEVVQLETPDSREVYSLAEICEKRLLEERLVRKSEVPSSRLKHVLRSQSPLPHFL